MGNHVMSPAEFSPFDSFDRFIPPEELDHVDLAQCIPTQQGGRHRKIDDPVESQPPEGNFRGTLLPEENDTDIALPKREPGRAWRELTTGSSSTPVIPTRPSQRLKAWRDGETTEIITAESFRKPPETSAETTQVISPENPAEITDVFPTLPSKTTYGLTRAAIDRNLDKIKAAHIDGAREEQEKRKHSLTRRTLGRIIGSKLVKKLTPKSDDHLGEESPTQIL